MSSGLRRPLIVDKVTDDETIKRIKDHLRKHLDDFVDLMETHPDLVEDWKVSSIMDLQGGWQSEADCAEAQRIQVAASNHFMRRHPTATLEERDSAYSAYSALARGHWVEKDPLP